MEASEGVFLYIDIQCIYLYGYKITCKERMKASEGVFLYKLKYSIYINIHLLARSAWRRAREYSYTLTYNVYVHM